MTTCTCTCEILLLTTITDTYMKNIYTSRNYTELNKFREKNSALPRYLYMLKTPVTTFTRINTMCC